MKKLILALTLSLFAVSSYAFDEKFVACRDLGLDEYNAVFKFEKNKIVSFATLEEDFKNYIPVDETKGILSFIWVSEYDTNLGYDVNLEKSNLVEMQLLSWTSGNDADNYHGVVNNVVTECHLLKQKPLDSVVRIENYDSNVSVKSIK